MQKIKKSKLKKNNEENKGQRNENNNKREVPYHCLRIPVKLALIIVMLRPHL